MQVYSNLKAFSFPRQIQAFKNEKLIEPVHVRIKPVNHCNHDCWYCAYRVSNLELGEDMNTKDFIPKVKMHEIADDLIKMNVKAVTFSGGGEPLIYKPLPEIIKKLSEGGIKIGTLSNGSNLKGHVADSFAKYATWIRISLDAWNGSSYAKARGVAVKEFDKLMTNMQLFVDRNSDCELGVSFIIDKNNASHVYEVVKKLKDIGVGHVKLAGVVVSNNGVENNQYHKSIKSLVRKEIDLAIQLNDQNFSVLDHYHDLDERFERNYTKCPTIQFTPIIGGDSCVYTCQDKAYTESGKLGSIKDISFKDFWFSEVNNTSSFSINPSMHCKHNCANHQKNKIITDFTNTKTSHIVFT
jgi:Fe-coproporphyrin III synthase